MKGFQLLLASSVFSLSTAALAQETPGQERPSSTRESSNSGSLMEDIIVNAQKKSVGENAQDVPIAITALGGEQLNILKFRELSDLTALSPNVSLNMNNIVRGYANFTIRGSTVNGSTPSVEPTVGLFVDGIYQGVAAGAVSNNFDLGNIQILRGPQGTLFGRNVTGGAVLVETTRPGKEFGGYIKAAYETGPEFGVEGAVDIPLSSALTARIAAYYREDQGWFHNDFNDSRVGESDTFIIRPTFVLETGALKQTFIFEYGNVGGDANPQQARNANNGPRPFVINLNNEGVTDRDWHSVTSETVIDVAFGDGAITNVFGYRSIDDLNSNDVDASDLDLYVLSFKVDHYQVSNELRYAGRFGPVDVTTGLYYLHQDLVYHQADAPFPAGARGGGGHQKHDSYGVFGQISIDVTDKLNLTGGLRYSYEKKAAQIVRLTAGRCTDIRQDCDFTDSPTVDQSRSWESLNPKIGVNYKVNPDVLLYASFSQAVRSGGYNLRLSGPLDPGTFDQENLNAYEIGVKADLFDRLLRVNAAAFRNDFTDLQRLVAIFVGTAAIQTIDNSADARIQGFEFDVTLQPVPDLQLTAGFGYLDGKYTDVRADLSGDGVVTQADYDLKLTRLPKYSLSLGAIHTLNFGSGASLRSSAFFTHLPKAAAQDSNVAFYEPSDDLRADITFTLPNRATSVSVYGRNLTNDADVYGGIAVLSAFPSGGLQGIREGRTFGVELRHKF